MKRAVVEFLKRERDHLARELNQLRGGERRVEHLNSGSQDITASIAAETEARLLRFEEMIAAFESGVA